MLKKLIAATIAVVFAATQTGIGQISRENTVFRNVKLVVNKDGKFRQESASLTFEDEKLTIDGKKGSSKQFPYTRIVSAEYSYSKNPRWKTGVGLSAAAILLPPLWLISIPIGFTKHRRHWLTIRTDDDFAVLKLRKGNRKHLIPTFETRSGVTVQALGEDK